jgi:hypothetical protein
VEFTGISKRRRELVGSPPEDARFQVKSVFWVNRSGWIPSKERTARRLRAVRELKLSRIIWRAPRKFLSQDCCPLRWATVRSGWRFPRRASFLSSKPENETVLSQTIGRDPSGNASGVRPLRLDHEPGGRCIGLRRAHRWVKLADRRFATEPEYVRRSILPRRRPGCPQPRKALLRPELPPGPEPPGSTGYFGSFAR